MNYIHQRDDWPDFRWNDAQLAAKLAAVRHRQGRLVGRMEAIGFSLREEAVLQTLTEDVIQSSETEGEHLDREQVRSSIARRLGMDVAGLVPSDRNVEGVVEMMLDATERILASVFRKANFWETHAAAGMNDRQRAMVNRLLTGFEGKLTTSKWAKIAKCSQDRLSAIQCGEWQRGRPDFWKS